MRGIPEHIYLDLYEYLDANICMRRHALEDHDCKGSITLEHAVIYAGRQVNELWAIITLCEYAHGVNNHQDGGIMIKEINEWIALSRILDWDDVDRKYERNTWRGQLDHLEEKYGEFDLSTIST